MRGITALAATAIAVLVVAGGASGGSPDGAAGPWADEVVRFVSGPRIDGSSIVTRRADPSAALGPAESPVGSNNPIPEGTFLSLGFGGSLTLAFQNPICNGPGVDLAIDVREITAEPYPAESADVYVSGDGVSFTKAGTVTRDARLAVPHTIPIVWFVAFVDVTPHSRFSLQSDADAFDVDGVSAVDMTSCSGTAPPMPPPGSGDPLAGTIDPDPAMVECSTQYWTNPRVLRNWPIARSQPFNRVFSVSAFPHKSLLAIVGQSGGGNRALAREGVFALLTSLTPDAGYRYKPAAVKKMVKTGLKSQKLRLVAQTITKLRTARSQGVCPRV